MAQEEELAERVRRTLAGKRAIGEVKMFGGLCFTLRGNMCCGTLKENLVVRVSPERYEKALAEPYTRPMDFTGRPIKGFVFVGPAGYKSEASLAKWVRWATDFTGSLPEKKKRQ